MALQSRVPCNLLGGPLQQADYTDFQKRWITRDWADAACLRRFNSLDAQELVGHTGSGDYSGIGIPYIWPGEDRIREWRLRLDHPPMMLRDGIVKPALKYLSPAGRGNLLYFAPGTDPSWLRDCDLPVVLTEGEFKTLALSRLSWHFLGDGAEHPAFLPIGLAGVWNWRGSVGKTTDAHGARVDVRGPIADLDHITWEGRRVIILFDADLETNLSVKTARDLLTRELQTRGAQVAWFCWPETVPSYLKGIDDYLAGCGPDEVMRLLNKARAVRNRKRGRQVEVVSPNADDWTLSLLRTSNGAPKGFLANALVALRQAPEWRGVIGFNEFSLGIHLLKPPPWPGAAVGSEWTDIEDYLFAEWLQQKQIPVNTRVAGEAVQTIAREYPFHPVRDFLKRLTWDGTRRLATWLEVYAGAEIPDPGRVYLEAVGMRWLISAVARVFEPGCKADHCPVFEGEQGLKKSTMIKTLAGEFFTDEIGEIGSKDAALQLRGVWLVEFAELDSIGRAEVAAVKAFISRTVDRFRPPYGRRVIYAPRQCVFAGTVNHSSYLRDDTGGRRFWPIRCTRIDVDALSRDREQLLAEAVVLYRSGMPWWLDTLHLHSFATQEQQARYDRDPWHELIARWIADPQQRRDRQGGPITPFSSDSGSVTIPDILLHCIGKPIDQWTQSDQNRIARCLNAEDWERYQQRVREAHRDAGESDRQWRYQKRNMRG